jgi:hypothetical protein
MFIIGQPFWGILFFSIIFSVWFHNVAFSQEVVFRSLNFEDQKNTTFIPISEIKKFPEEITFFSTIPLNNTIYPMDANSYLFVDIQKRIKKCLSENIVPDIPFIVKNTRLYQLEQTFQSSQKVYVPIDIQVDTSFTLIGLDRIKILIVCNARDWGYATMIFFLKEGKINLKLEDFLAKRIIDLCNNEQSKETSITVQKDDFQTDVRNKEFPQILNHSGGFCLLCPKFLPDELRPARVVLPNKWFTFCKEYDEFDKFQKQEIMKLQKQFKEMTTECRELVTSVNGRTTLIDRLGKSIEVNFESSEFFSKDFRDFIYDTINDYYITYYDKESEKLFRDSVWSPERIVSTEIDSLRKLLQSDDLQAKSYAMQIIEAVNGRSLVSDLLKLCADKKQVTLKEQIVLESNSLNSDRRSIKSPKYRFMVYYLLGKLGDKKTLESLEKLKSTSSISQEVIEDIDLAVEDIKKHIAENDRLKKLRQTEIKPTEAIIDN